MAVSSKHILQQGPVLGGFGRLALAALRRRPSGGGGAFTAPGPELFAEFAPRPRALVKDYVRHVGGDPRAYRDHLPAHLFPQWCFGLAARTLGGLPYNIAKVMNGGCRYHVKQPLPVDERLNVRVRLESVDANDRRVLIQQRVVTGTKSAPDALIADLFVIIPQPRKPGGARGKKERPRVPDGARELAYWKIRADAGLDFAKLTGDFNPIHWIGPYARISGFKNTILHGFATMARTVEGLHRAHAGASSVVTFECRFTRPLVLPARTGLYADADRGVFVGDAAGGPAYLVGSYAMSHDEPGAAAAWGETNPDSSATGEG